MSRQQRSKGIWPADVYAVHVWHLSAALEDIQTLARASEAATDPLDRVALIKKMLVELKSFDGELVPKLEETVKTSTPGSVTAEERKSLIQAIGSYHRAVQPGRELLANIRNVVGAHRRGLPEEADRKKFGSDFVAWGAWEQQLVELEAKCELSVWLDFVNAAIALLNEVLQQVRGSWFSIRGNELRQYVPLRFA
jgi:hypothetical protein